MEDCVRYGIFRLITRTERNEYNNIETLAVHGLVIVSLQNSDRLDIGEYDLGFGLSATIIVTTYQLVDILTRLRVHYASSVCRVQHGTYA